MNYFLNLLRACGQVSPSTSPLALKRMLLRGKDFDEMATLANAEEIKRSLLGSGCSNGDVQDKQRKLKFEIQMKERELERMESLEANNSDKADDRMDHLKEAVKKLSAELQHLENSIGTQSLPQVDYLKKAMTFSFSVTYTTSPVLISRIV